MAEIVLAPPADLTKERERAQEEYMEQMREADLAMQRVFLFIVTVVPALLGVAAMVDGK